MKVCTDACLFGAIVAATDLKNARCLDIGTGTGLLTLMIAQKNDIEIIDAVELNRDAATQALENISASLWKDKIKVHQEDILSFKPEKQYDYIISNPPFFEDDLNSPDEAKNNAKHSTTLSLSQLLVIADKHLTKDGVFTVLLPYPRVKYFTEEALKAGFHLTEQILVKQTFKHKFFRGILFLSRKDSVIQKTEINIKDADYKYTPEFTAYLKDYYLFL